MDLVVGCDGAGGGRRGWLFGMIGYDIEAIRVVVPLLIKISTDGHHQKFWSEGLAESFDCSRPPQCPWILLS